MKDVSRQQLIDELIAALHRARNRFAESNRHVYQQFGLTPTQWQIIRCITHHQLRHQKDIAEHLGISKGAVAQQVDELIQKGLLEKIPDPADRRRQLLRLTEKTKKLKAEMYELMTNNLADIFESLTDEELTGLVRILKKIGQPG